MKKILLIVALLASAPAYAYWLTMYQAGSYYDQSGRQICVFEGGGHRVAIVGNGICPISVQYNHQTGEIRK